MITIAVNVTDRIIVTKSHLNNVADIYIRGIKCLSKLNFCTSVNVTDRIISTKSHLNNVADIYIRDIKCLSKLNFCTSVNVTHRIICAKSYVNNVTDIYIGYIRHVAVELYISYCGPHNYQWQKSCD